MCLNDKTEDQNEISVNHHLIAQSYRKLADIYLADSQFKDAGYYFQKAIDFVKKSPYKLM